MSIRFLLIAHSPDGDARAEARLAELAGLSCSARASRFTLLCNRPTPRLGGNGPIVVGDVFTRRECAAAVGEIRPAALLETHWGRYVAIWPERDGRLRLLRDPSGGLSCYYHTCAGVSYVASDLELLKKLLPRRPAVSWPDIHRILAAADLPSPSTALEGVHELPAGSMLELHDGGAHVRPCWSPWASLNRSSNAPFAECAAMLRVEVERVLSAYGKRYPEALVPISGGLDSSIVATGLRRSVDSLTCLTLATKDPSGDERRYAAPAAAAAAATYAERWLDGAAVDLEHSQTAHLPRPLGRPFFKAFARIVAEEAAERRVGTIFTGTGGDNVFCSLRSATPVIDALLGGRVSAAATAARDMRALTGASYAEVLRSVAGRMMRPRRYRWRQDRSYLCQPPAEQQYSHPWLVDHSDYPPGHAARVAMLLRVQNYLEQWYPAGRPDIVNPLLAQPIVECCLSIPTWRWCHGGMDRAVARRAFADRLPPVIVQRSWKGGPDTFVNRLAESNRSVIRSRLAAGELAERQIVDRAAIMQRLDDVRPFSAEEAQRLLALTDAEAWVRQHS